MADRFQMFRWLLQDPASNTPAAGIAVAAVVLLVIIVALILIAFALPGRPRRRAKTPDAEADTAQATRRSTPTWIVTLTIIGMLSVGFVIATGVWYKATSTEQYCTSMCHAMAEPSESWSTSAHSGVSCVRCHEGRPWVSFGSGVRQRGYSLYLQLTGARAARREVPVSTCLGCHETVLDLKLTARNGETFTHRAVIGSRNCIACHGQQGHEPPRPKSTP